MTSESSQQTLFSKDSKSCCESMVRHFIFLPPIVISQTRRGEAPELRVEINRAALSTLVTCAGGIADKYPQKSACAVALGRRGATILDQVVDCRPQSVPTAIGNHPSFVRKFVG